jgi:hypothetical protein
VNGALAFELVGIYVWWNSDFRIECAVHREKLL